MRAICSEPDSIRPHGGLLRFLFQLRFDARTPTFK